LFVAPKKKKRIRYMFRICVSTDIVKAVLPPLRNGGLMFVVTFIDVSLCNFKCISVAHSPSDETKNII
jgi:hypothetical protein